MKGVFDYGAVYENVERSFYDYANGWIRGCYNLCDSSVYQVRTRDRENRQKN